MKKLLIKAIALMMALVCLCPVTAYAEEPELPEDVEWYDLNLTEEEAEEIMANNPQSSIQPYATGLISSYNIGVGADGNTLKVVAKTYGTIGVVKAGFTEIRVQRRKNVTQAWSDYATYSDIYNNTSSYLFSKAITVTGGYIYRATCVHYAKKNIFSVQKINNASNIIGI